MYDVVYTNVSDVARSRFLVVTRNHADCSGVKNLRCFSRAEQSELTEWLIATLRIGGAHEPREICWTLFFEPERYSQSLSVFWGTFYNLFIIIFSQSASALNTSNCGYLLLETELLFISTFYVWSWKKFLVE